MDAKSKLVKCPECGHEMGRTADKCPNCGTKNAVLEKEKLKNGLYGCLTLIVLAVIIPLCCHSKTPKTPPAAAKAEPEYVTPNAKITVSMVQLAIKNMDDFNWMGVTLELNPGTFSNGFEKKIGFLAMGEERTINLIEFTKDTERFNPLTYTVKDMRIRGASKKGALLAQYGMTN